MTEFLPIFFIFFSGRRFLCFSKRILTKGGCLARPLEAAVGNGEGKELFPCLRFYAHFEVLHQKRVKEMPRFEKKEFVS